MIFRKILALLFPLILFLSAWGWGRSLLKFFRFSFTDRSDSITFSSLLGLGTLGNLLLVFGVTHLFYPGLLWGLLACGVILSFLWLWESGGRDFKLKKRGGFGKDNFSTLYGGAVLLILVFTFLRLRVPAVVGDELSYHLYLPKMFLLKHQVFFWPYHVNSVFPLLIELLYSYGVNLGSEFAAKSVHFLFGILTSFSLYSLSRDILKKPSPGWAGMLFLTVPIVSHQMGIAKNDLALTAFVTAGYACLFHWNSEKKNSWLVLAGVFSGFSMGVKYLGLFWMSVQLVLVTGLGLSQGKSFKKILGFLFLFVGPILGVSSVWYLRSYLYTGNPIYPYLTSWFGGVGLENSLQLEGKGFGKDIAAFFLLPFHATFKPEAFGGLSNQWGPLFLGFLPWLYKVKPRTREWKAVLIITLLSTLLWFLSKQNLRFLLPVLPFFCLIVVGALRALQESDVDFKRWASGFFLLGILLHLGVLVFQFRDDYRVVLGLEGREDYLRRKVPVYEVAEFLNHEKRRSFKVLSSEHRVYYFNGEVVREKAYRRLHHYDKPSKNRGREWYQKFLEEGFTHLLVARSSEEPAENPLRNLIQDPSFPKNGRRLVKQVRLSKSPWGPMEYELYELEPLLDVA